jgi:ABC-type Mn2+/Zn2+ transport system ATPase subunit
MQVRRHPPAVARLDAIERHRRPATFFGVILDIVSGVPAAVTISDIHVDYGTVHAVGDLSLEIPQGASVAVIGPNGSGKSTLLKVIAGILEPNSGSLDTHGAATAIVLQSTDVDPSVPITVRDVVAMARYPSVGLLRRFGADDRAAVQSALERLDIADLADRQIHHLSGGQRQRAFVAQGLAQEAPILLLDEPLTGLDVRSRSVIADVFDVEHSAGRTVITTTHNFEDAAQCDLVLLLATRFVAFGVPDDVFTEDHLKTAFGGRVVRAGDTLVIDDPHHDHHH